MAMSKSVCDVDLSTTVYIITHGGCPDGQAAAWIMLHALKVRKADVDVHVIQGAHGARVVRERLPAGSVLLFCDVCPVQGDAENIESAQQVFVLDHHPTAPKDMAPLKEKYGDKITDLSVTDPKIGECGASLVQKFCVGTFSMHPDLLELFWKLDVFSHKIDPRVQEMLNPFKGYITQNGPGACTMELVDALAADMDMCLKQGDVLFEPVRQSTLNHMKGRKIVHSEPGLMIVVVDVDALLADGTIGDTQMDGMIYQNEIDTLKQDGVAIAFLTVSRKINPTSGAWNLGLRRAGDHLDMGKVAAHLRDRSEHFVSGGGHAFAAGAQSKNPELAVSDFIADVTAACRASLSSFEPKKLECAWIDTSCSCQCAARYTGVATGEKAHPRLVLQQALKVSEQSNTVNNIASSSCKKRRAELPSLLDLASCRACEMVDLTADKRHVMTKDAVSSGRAHSIVFGGDPINNSSGLSITKESSDVDSMTFITGR